MSGHHGHQGLPVGQDHRGLPMLGTAGQGLADRAHPSQEQGSRRASGTSLGMGQEWADAGLGCGSTGGPGSAEPMTRQGCGELETSPAVALLGQELMSPGG